MMEDKTVEVLDRADCLDLLARSHLGRLAFLDLVGVLPIIVPVNYVLHEGAVTFRTDAGSTLSAALHGVGVAFEIDGLDEVRGTGWSVVVRGFAEVVTDGSETLPPAPRPWAPGEKSHYVRVRSSKISGRRITGPTRGRTGGNEPWE
jgi:nitroimidazol reductase NimA-like FMN-containing flavoprotein (pyridoxamine 5'-phosphate oxidase superfamily)